MHPILNRLSHVLLVSLSPLLLVSHSPSRADIFQWEYIDPADPSQGKQQSTTLAPDGVGVDAVPGADLSFRNLTMAYLIDMDFQDASFYATTLTDADLSGADVRGTSFGAAYFCGFGWDCGFYGTGISPAQLYSTASYQAHDLRGVSFEGNTVDGVDLVGQNLTHARFGGVNLAGTNFRAANVANVNFVTPLLCDPYWGSCGPTLYAKLTDADLTAVDARGASGLDFSLLSDAITTNLIRPDGHIDGLDLDAELSLVIRDYLECQLWWCALGPIPITVDQHLAMGPDGTLRMVFEADAWDSTISFAPGIPVTLGGTLELTFAADVHLASQLGRTFDLFDWTGVTPTGAFTVSSPYAWDLSNLYTTGQVTLAAIPEPAGLALFLLAAATLFVAYRTRSCVDLRTSHRCSTAGLLVSFSPLLLVSPSPARADIFQWEYINPADPSQGKQQSTTLAPDGAGIDAVPGANLSSRNLTMAYLIGADLTAANGILTNLNDADLSQSNLAKANFGGATLTGADLSHTNLTDAYFSATGFPCDGGDGDLSICIAPGATLTGANFVNANIRGANFEGASLTGADFTGANVQGASFSKWPSIFLYGTGITPSQLYSTTSYEAHELSGIDFSYNDFAGGKFVSQNLTNAIFFDTTLTDVDFTQASLANAAFEWATLTGANFREANLANAIFSNAKLTGADFSAADARGAYDLPGSVVAANLIRPDGHIDGLDLDSRGRLFVRDYDRSGYFIPITIDQHLAMGPGGTLRIVFEADAWDSTISFAPGIPVTLGGTLELTFAAEVNLASQVGRTFDLFDWTGVNPTGAFAISSPYAWDLSNLYTTGEVTLTAIPEPSIVMLLIVAAAGALINQNRGRGDRCRMGDFALPMGRFEGPRS